ncbi:MAG: nucleotidyltransferase family protein [Clostridiales bacterium]|nr:nucleotidyltransferase family protein [Clostridiales bacterium]
MKIAAVILAAGLSKRFGSQKLLHPVDGKPMPAHTIDALAGFAFDKRICVLSDATAALQSLTQSAGYTVCHNPAPEQGVSQSVRIGLAAARDMDGILFAVGDQPYLQPASIVRLLDKFAANPQNIIALAANGQRGNPVIFPSSLFSELEKIEGDKGGSAVIAKYPELLILCEIEDATELEDIDVGARYIAP